MSTTYLRQFLREAVDLILDVFAGRHRLATQDGLLTASHRHAAAHVLNVRLFFIYFNDTRGVRFRKETRT